MPTIAVILACISADDCRPFIGEQMPMFTCIATSQVMLADFAKQYPGYTIKGISCVDPKRLAALLGRSEA